MVCHNFGKSLRNIFTLALKLKVQLFITTQSLEAIEAILKFGNYETNQDNDPIKIITLRKIYEEVTCSHKIVARNVLGRYVYENQKTCKWCESIKIFSLGTVDN